MLSDFRPVREDWGEHSGSFVDRETLIAIIDAIAGYTIEREYPGEFLEHSNYGEVEVVWILRGSAFLTFIESDEFTAQWVIDELEDIEVIPDEVNSLTENMKALAPKWQAMLERDGSLRFYVD